jgi:hypothetical protein
LCGMSWATWTLACSRVLPLESLVTNSREVKRTQRVIGAWEAQD